MNSQQGDVVGMVCQVNVVTGASEKTWQGCLFSTRMLSLAAAVVFSFWFTEQFRRTAQRLRFFPFVPPSTHGFPCIALKSTFI